MGYEVRVFSEANDGRYFVWFMTGDRTSANEYAADLQARRRRNRVVVAEVA